MRLLELVETSRKVAGTSGRREKIDRLAALLVRLAPAEVATGVAFLAGAPRQGRIGIGPAALRAARPAAGAGEPVLDLIEVDRQLERIAGTGGKGSSAERVALLRDLLARATAPEQDFLLRLLLGELRQGALEGIAVEALSKAAGLPDGLVRRALLVSGDLAAVARAALAGPGGDLARFAIAPFRPLKPMLAQPAGDVVAALERLGRAAFEFKLDGARVQVHKAGGEVRVFSRGLHEVTAAVPEVVEAVLSLPAREAILDGEAIALGAGGRPLPFQVTMRRFGRKLDVERLRGEIPIAPFLFDLLYLDGEDLTAEPQARRFAALAEIVPGRLLVAHRVTSDLGQAGAFLEEALERGHEGVMAKDLGSPYEGGSRGLTWLKVKPAHTLDLVVLAAEWGHGRRRGRLSNLHLGARDAERGGFVMLGKTFKGLTDAMLAWQTEKLLGLAIGREGHVVHVRPELVAEVAFNDLQASPQYPGGLALRFARVKRYRPDKTAAEADSFAAVRQLSREATGREPPR